MEVKIEKNVPRPGPASMEERRDILRSMEVGDSFFLAMDGEGHLQNQTYQRFYHPAIALGMKISVHTVEGGVRLWRVL